MMMMMFTTWLSRSCFNISICIQRAIVIVQFITVNYYIFKNRTNALTHMSRPKLRHQLWRSGARPPASALLQIYFNLISIQIS